jgi:hypothetical protein
MQTTRLVILPVDVLWEYREFRRDEIPAPQVPFFLRYSVEEITEYVSVNGFEPIELSVIKNLALLTDGNHRIIAARRLGLNKILVKVTVFFGDGSETFYEHTLNRFKPIDAALEHELKKLFLGEGNLDCDVRPDADPPAQQEGKQK